MFVMTTLWGAQGFSCVPSRMFMQILIADKTYCTVTLVAQRTQSSVFPWCKSIKETAFQILSIFAGSIRNFFLSWNPEDLLNLPFPLRPTSPAYKREMWLETKEQTLAYKLCPVAPSLFSVPCPQYSLLNLMIYSLARHLDIRLQTRVFLITECSWNQFSQSRVPGCLPQANWQPAQIMIQKICTQSSACR